MDGVSTLVADLADLGPGSHLCRFYDDEQDLARGAASFVECALASGHRLLYVTNDRRAEKVQASLQVHGVHVEHALQDGQLQVRSFEEVYGHGTPQLRRVENHYRSLAERATADGLIGLRVAAEMGDAVHRFGSLEHLLQWEEIATRWIRDIGVSTVCQYDRRRFPATELEQMAARHTGQAPGYARPPLAGFYVDSGGLRIVGEIDASNTENFLQVVAARLSVQPCLRLDLEGLAFVDVSGLVGLFDLVQSRPPCELLLHHASPSLRRCLDMAGLHHPRVVVS